MVAEISGSKGANERKGNLDEVMNTFFNTLYQKMFTVLNSQYRFDNKYLECVGQHMKEMKPFGDIPQKLGVQIKRSFIATRAFSQALQVSSEVLKKMQQLKATDECSAALTRMTLCPSCSGINEKVLACNNMCENVMKGCLTQHAALDSDWNQFVEAVDKVAERLLGPFNIELLVQPINYKISEAIMNFQENSNDVSQRVFAGCGRPVLGRRRKRSVFNENNNFDKLKSMNVRKDFGPKANKKDENDEEKHHEKKGEEHTSSVIILDKLVKEIKQRIRDSRQFWLYLPYKLCNDGLVVPPSNTNDCWNGTHIDKYVYPVSSSGETQILNPEVRFLGSRTAIVNEQIFALNTISNRLRLAFNGHDVDWVDIQDNWSSGSGSGSNSLDPTEITDDEDGFSEGSGYETTTSSDVSEKEPIKPKASNGEILQLPTMIVITGDKLDRNYNVNMNSVIQEKHDLNITLKRNSGISLALQQRAYPGNFKPYFYIIVVVWMTSFLTK